MWCRFPRRTSRETAGTGQGGDDSGPRKCALGHTDRLVGEGGRGPWAPSTDRVGKAGAHHARARTFGRHRGVCHGPGHRPARVHRGSARGHRPEAIDSRLCRAYRCTRVVMAQVFVRSAPPIAVVVSLVLLAVVIPAVRVPVSTGTNV